MRAANGDGLETVVVRPRFVWGRGDTSLLPAIIELVTSGRFRWVGGGRHLTATTHIDNTVEGLWLAATRGPAGGVWFVTDGEPVVFREFLTAMVGHAGRRDPRQVGAAPRGGRGGARARSGYGAACGVPAPRRSPASPSGSSLQECTIDISRAERELGYRPVTTREEGLREMRASPPG